MCVAPGEETTEKGRLVPKIALEWHTRSAKDGGREVSPKLSYLMMKASISIQFEVGLATNTGSQNI